MLTLEQLFPGEIVDVPSYVKHSSRLNSAVGAHVCALLALGTTVVLDFPGNTKKQRAWFRELFEQAGVAHELHFIDAPDALCNRAVRLVERVGAGTYDLTPEYNLRLDDRAGNCPAG